MPSLEADLRIRQGADGKWYAVDTNAETTDGEWHKIISVPEHGRLIEADVLYESCALDHNYDVMATTTRINEYMQLKIDSVPTVIPAEETHRDL